jgi:hypothetical protein
VLHLLRGEDLDAPSRQLKATAVILSECREADGCEEKIAALTKRLTETPRAQVSDAYPLVLRNT